MVLWKSSTRTGREWVPVLPPGYEFTLLDRLLQEASTTSPDSLQKARCLALPYRRIMTTRHTVDNQQGFSNKPEEQMVPTDKNLSFIFFLCTNTGTVNKQIPLETHGETTRTITTTNTWEPKAELSDFLQALWMLTGVPWKRNSEACKVWHS